MASTSRRRERASCGVDDELAGSVVGLDVAASVKTTWV